MNKIDSAGLKFKILRELGEDVDISFVKFNEGLASKLYVRGHEYSDGLGFFADLYEHHYKEKITQRLKKVHSLLGSQLAAGQTSLAIGD